MAQDVAIPKPDEHGNVRDWVEECNRVRLVELTRGADELRRVLDPMSADDLRIWSVVDLRACAADFRRSLTESSQILTSLDHGNRAASAAFLADKLDEGLMHSRAFIRHVTQLADIVDELTRLAIRCAVTVQVIAERGMLRLPIFSPSSPRAERDRFPDHPLFQWWAAFSEIDPFTLGGVGVFTGTLPRRGPGLASGILMGMRVGLYPSVCEHMASVIERSGRDLDPKALNPADGGGGVGRIGPYATGCFRYKTLDRTEIGRKQWDLLVALWDRNAAGPKPEVDQAEVWRAVYKTRPFNRRTLYDLVTATNERALGPRFGEQPVIEVAFTHRGSDKLRLVEPEANRPYRLTT